MPLHRHARALVAFLLIAANLTVWCVPLSVLVTLRLLGLNSALQLDRIAGNCYRWAVTFDDWCLNNISGCTWDADKIELSKTQSYIVISNHVSWADIFILQSGIARNGPIIKFLCKKQLLFVPIFALIILAFRFPVVRRKSWSGRNETKRRAQDLAIVREACKVLEQSPAAMLVFAEGTRFTRKKHMESKSNYNYLLPPRTAGFSVLVQSLAEFEPSVLNCTLHYPKDMTFWQFLGGGQASNIRFEVEAWPWTGQLTSDPATWLREAWSRKDEKLS